MAMYANAGCTVHYATQDFTAITEIGQLHKGLGSKGVILGFPFLLSPGSVYIGFDVGSGDS